jgi:hypothetical protein
MAIKKSELYSSLRASCDEPNNKLRDKIRMGKELEEES